jgi:hypothetical protein
MHVELWVGCEPEKWRAGLRYIFYGLLLVIFPYKFFPVVLSWICHDISDHLCP